ncbi:hypothetical protein [Streptosporangium saharense]|uniref:hypothetical protein n=1 Tax=Streptosporangium saharense TaxID=1706840 RepID=UPI00342623E4
MTALTVAPIASPVPDQALTVAAALLTAADALAALRQARVMGMEAAGIIRQAVAPAPVELVLDPLDDYLRSIGQDPAVLYRWATPLSKVQVVEWLRGAASQAVAQ